MKKTIAILAFIFLFCGVVVAQETDEILVELEFDEEPNSAYNALVKLKASQGSLSDCEFAKLNANKDFEKGVFSQHSSSFSGHCSYCAVLLQDYNIELYGKMDVFSEVYYECYDSVMKKKLINKYGYDIFKRARNKADSLIKTDNWISDPEYIGGRDELTKFIQARLTLGRAEVKEEVEVKRILIAVIVIIGSNGEVVTSEILKGTSKKIDKQVLEVIHQLPKFKPAYLFGKPIKGKYAIPLYLEHQ